MWCGKNVLCCKKGYWDKSNGCDGTLGGQNRHECVENPYSGNTDISQVWAFVGKPLYVSHQC